MMNASRVEIRPLMISPSLRMPAWSRSPSVLGIFKPGTFLSI